LLRVVNRVAMVALLELLIIDRLNPFQVAG